MIISLPHPRISIAFLVLLASSAVNLTYSQTTLDLPIRSTISTPAPMSGIVLWSDSPNVATDAVTLEFRYCGYDEVVQPDGTYDFSFIDQLLDQIAARNHQAILRFHFVYPGKPTTVPKSIRELPNYNETVAKSEGKTTSFCDWSHDELKRFTLEFYQRFAHRYDRDRRIAYLQTGFGLWGEYHIYSGPHELGKTFPDKEFQAEFIRHMDSCFENLTWSVSVDAVDPQYSPLKNNPSLLGINFGVFDDSFLCEEHPKYNAVNWKSMGTDRWQRAPGGGEFSYYNNRDQRLALSPSGPNGVPFEKDAARFHITYMIGNDQPKYQSLDRIKDAGMAIGYRFRIIQVQAILEHPDSKTVTVIITATNDGVAPIYRDAYFAAAGIRASESLLGLLPGQECVFTIESVPRPGMKSITIQSDWVLPSQTIPFAGLPTEAS
ncbi:hypothetical protein SAMN06265222_12186 [Neorhodopirellula lusitana]|uniref:DUF4832 domain-containing protein n=1 Tax=Neorhodopirellula lusitana TaxID=445327 RepID=A0ABY1QST0_9BACT|nr:hypothetical protein SAMN06265222_12186 [Neorhodopirellula lusitana]